MAMKQAIIAFVKKYETCLSVFIFIGLPLILLFAPSVLVYLTTNRQSFDKIAKLPKIEAGIVLGTSPKLAGKDNPYFVHRIEAAAALFKEGKIKYILVSGDNLSDPENYDEPRAMKDALIAQSVPAKAIISDPKGISTMDSIVRAKQVFGIDEAIIISQAFHNHRAIYIARQFNMTAYGYNAKDVTLKNGSQTHIREIFARVKMWLHLHTPLVK